MSALPKADPMEMAPRVLLRSLFDTALTAVDPLHCVPAFLPPRPKGRTLVLGAGKASARMARAVEAAWDGPLSGLVVTRYGHGERCERIKIVESGHPVPDEAGAIAAEQMLAMAREMGPDDLVLALVSGGGSSLITLPAEGLSMTELRAVNVALLRSGAHISDMNMVRRHLSRIKGGRLAQACGAAAVHTLVVSDVPGDDPAVVASGPTLADHSSPLEALAVLQRHQIEVSPAVLEVLRRPTAVQDRSDGPRHVQVIATAELALNAAVAEAQRQRLAVINLGGAVEGESREVAAAQAAMAKGLREAGAAGGRPRIMISGG
ncbi:MAG: glycerate kinase type-2 family protein, partial [Burkholderiaceae bacterium]